MRTLPDTGLKAGDVDVNFGCLQAQCSSHGKHCKLWLRFVGKEARMPEIFDEVYHWVSLGRETTPTEHDDHITRIKAKFGVRMR